MVGREREIEDLRRILAATAAGSGGVVVLTGPAGIGKTRLLRAARTEADGLGLATAYGGASEVDRLAPLTTLTSVLRHGRPGRVDLPPAAPASPLGLIDRAGAAIEEFASRRPLAIMIDDVQWADELSALAFRVLVPQLQSSPVRWVLARRPLTLPTPGHDAVDWLIGDPGVEQIRIGPLDARSVQRLCANVLHAEPDPTVLTLAADGPGNPYLIVQWLDALLAADQIMIEDGVATIVGDDLPAGFVDAVNQRLRTLSPKARRLLEAGSIFRRPFTLDGAARLLGMRTVDLVNEVREATTAGVLVDRDGDLAFAHDLMRQAVYQHLSGSVRTAMHREAAAVVRDESRSAVEIAEHLTHSGTTRDRAAVEVLRTAATEIAGRAPAMAATFIEHALSLLDADDPARADLSALAVGLLASAGRLSKARELGETALDAGLDDATTARLLLGLAESFKHAGHNRAAVEYARRGLAPGDVPDGIRARLRSVEAHSLLFDDLSAADHAGAEADRLGMASGDHAASVFGCTARSVVARATGHLDRALTFATRAVETADRVRGDALHRHPRIWLGAALAAVDRFAEADSAFVIGRHEAESLGTAWSQPLWHFYHASLLTANGRLDDAAAEAEAGLGVAEQLTARQLSLPLLGLLIRLAVLRDQNELAHAYVRQMRHILAKGVTSAPEDVDWTTALLQHADGPARVAMRTVDPIFDRLPDRLFLFTYEPGAARDLVRIALDADAPDRARLVVSAARTLAERNPGVATLVGTALNVEGLLRRSPTLLRAAVDKLRDSPRRLVRASAKEDAAAADLSAGRRDDAVTLLTEAMDEYADCGALAPARRVQARLRTIGTLSPVGAAAPVTLVSEPTSTLAVTPLLTPAEWPVAERVARGMTNRQIAADITLSRHTVDTHLRHIFQKLQVNSRSAVAAWVIRYRNP